MPARDDTGVLRCILCRLEAVPVRTYLVHMIAEHATEVTTAHLQQTLLQLASAADVTALRAAVAVLRELVPGPQVKPEAQPANSSESKSDPDAAYPIPRILMRTDEEIWARLDKAALSTAPMTYMSTSLREAGATEHEIAELGAQV